MKRSIVFTNRKGGCGKTTTAVNVAAAFAHMGRRVLLIDTDPQAHATMSFGIEQGALSADLTAVLRGEISARGALRRTHTPRLTILPASRRLAAYERNHAGDREARTRLAEVLGDLDSTFEFVIFDTPPTSGLLTVQALVAATEAYIPMQSHFLAMEGMVEIVEVVDQVRKHYNRELEIKGIIPTFVGEQKEISRQIMEEVEDELGEGIFLKPVRINDALAEAPGFGKTVFQYDIRSRGALDYYRVAQEILDRR
ncbi:MAG: ParA family protein [Alkalispirochaetaceae bacterium]